MSTDKKILVLGNGFLGNTFKRHGYEVAGREMFQWGVPPYLGGTKATQNTTWLETQFSAYDAVVNCIAKSDTRWCEDIANFDELMLTNYEIPKFLSEVCNKVGTKFVQISTGCLYDVRNEPQKETAFKSAHCNYVVSKWVGEAGCNHPDDLIIRPRLIFDSEKPKNGTRNNLICKFEEFSNFLAEQNTITSNDTIVEAIEALLDADQSGIFNVGQTGRYSIVDMAKHLGYDTSQNVIMQEDLHESQGLYLVNNLMDLSKLEEFYQPRDALEELKRCRDILDETEIQDMLNDVVSG